MPRRTHKYWTGEKVLQVIEKLQARGERLNFADAARAHPDLAYAGVKYFGSWAATIKAAGLDYTKVRLTSFWNRELVVKRIRELKKAGQPLNIRAIEQNHRGLAGAALVYHGSWRKAVTAAGLDYKKIKLQKEWSKAEVASEIRRMHREGLPLGTTIPVRAKYRILHAAAIRYFGSWAAAMKAAQLERLLRQ